VINKNTRALYFRKTPVEEKKCPEVLFLRYEKWNRYNLKKDKEADI